ncbi:hypothetical protein NKH77_02810 [Streptomyces sp. M19]
MELRGTSCDGRVRAVRDRYDDRGTREGAYDEDADAPRDEDWEDHDEPREASGDGDGTRPARTFRPCRPSAGGASPGPGGAGRG